MFDELDLDKLLEEEAKREALKKEYGNYGEAELELSIMREGFLKKANEKNVKSLSKLEENVKEIGDVELPFSKEVERVAKELEEEQSTETSEENTEVNNDEDNAQVENIETVHTSDVESEDVKHKQANDAWLKEKEELYNLNKQKDELLALMFNEIENLKKVASQPKVEEKQEVKEEVKQISDEEIAQFAKNITTAISYGKEDEASENLAKLLAAMKQPKVEVKEFSEDKIEEILIKLEQKKYNESFEKAKLDFFNTEEGKKILADEDLFDLYTVKFNKLKNSGVHLNPEDLLKKASEATFTVINKTNSSMASKPVPKVADSLKEDVSKLEATKKQAVKPNSSSNVTKQIEGNKKYDPLQEYKDFIFKTTGQKI